MAASAGASTVGLPEDQAYLLHHFNCPYAYLPGNAWKAAAMPGGPKKLWDAYNQAARPPQHPQAAPITTPLNKKPRTSGLNF